jgi:uncharacterized protein YfiM (DUF2279 family)
VAGRGVTRGALALALLATLASARAQAQGRDPWLGSDKALHFAATFTLAGAGYAAAAPLVREPVPRLGVAAMLAMGAGIGKEMHDRATGRDPSLRDLAWDALGTSTGLLVAWLVSHYLLPRGRR